MSLEASEAASVLAFIIAANGFYLFGGWTFEHSAVSLLILICATTMMIYLEVSA